MIVTREDPPDKDLPHNGSCPDCPGCILIAARNERRAIDLEMWRREMEGS